MDRKEVDLTPQPVVGLMLQVGGAEKFPQALDFESLDASFSVSKQVHVSQALRRMQVTRDLCCWNLLAKLVVLHRQRLLLPKSGHCCHC